MAVTREQVIEALKGVALPDGGDVVSADYVRALTIEGDAVRFVLEVPAEKGPAMEPVREAAERTVAALPGVGRATVILTAHVADPKAAPPPPNLKIGGHPKPQQGPTKIAGVDHVIAVASGKGGVGKSTVSANLAVALARAGRRVGLLDADIYGPSQHKMMGLPTARPRSPDGETILPLEAHGVKFISMGSMMQEGEAVIWRGPMLMGALQQFLGQVQWDGLDVLIVDLPPGTGDVQITLAQKAEIDGAVVVSTPQDIALADARRAITMFEKTNTPVLGMIENMAVYVCPNCGHEDHLFGQGGARAEAEKLKIPFLGEIPLTGAIREAADAGRPIAAGEGPVAEAYAAIARQLIDRGLA